MKIYKQKPPEILVRVNIKQQSITYHITLEETTSIEFLDFATNLINSLGISPIQKGKVTTIEARDAIGGTNGKSQSISFKGLSPEETYNHLISKLT